MTNKMDEQLDALLVKLLSDTGAKTKPVDNKAELMELAKIYHKKYTEAKDSKSYWVDHCTEYFKRITAAEKDMCDARGKVYELCGKLGINYQKFLNTDCDCDESDDE